MGPVAEQEGRTQAACEIQFRIISRCGQVARYVHCMYGMHLPGRSNATLLARLKGLYTELLDNPGQNISYTYSYVLYMYMATASYP